MSLVLEFMSRKPSSQPQAGRVLGISQQAVNKAVLYQEVGPDILSRLLRFLVSKGAIGDPSPATFMSHFGPDSAKKWTWERVMSLPMSPEQRNAITVARKVGATASAVGRVLTWPPWTSAAFHGRPPPFWVSEFRWITEREAKHAAEEEMADQLARWTHEEAQALKSA